MADEARVTQTIVELLDAQPVEMYQSQQVVELLDAQPVEMRVGQLVVEIIYQMGEPPPPPIPEPGPNPVPTLLPSIYQWRLYRCDNKPRPEQSQGGGLA